jgi:hypothetical protein
MAPRGESLSQAAQSFAIVGQFLAGAIITIMAAIVFGPG